MYLYSYTVHMCNMEEYKQSQHYVIALEAEYGIFSPTA
jgi:hypothetical protein